MSSSFAVAVPLGHFMMNRWLQDFAYHIDVTPTTFLMAGVLSLLIAVITVSYQAIKTALANPVKSLRYE